MDCNWKVAVEAFQEVYHFRFIHDRGGFSVLDSRGATMGLFTHGNSRMVVPHSKEVVAATPGRESWRDMVEVPSADGLANIPGVHPIVHSTSYSFTVFPNLITPVGAIGFPILLFFPDGPKRTKLQIYHFAPSWGGGPYPPEWDKRMETFGTIIDEDVENLAPMFRAMEAPNFDGVPLSYQERRIWHFNETIDRVIGVEKIPEHLRVAPLLDAYIEQ
jgi:phenylpropionate dioxygenase-like ring-hydroxylating dioxygenase large terminal subunit